MTSRVIARPYMTKAAAFLADIGLQVLWRPGASGFVDHIAIIAGTLPLDTRCSASAPLHEANSPNSCSAAAAKCFQVAMFRMRDIPRVSLYLPTQKRSIFSQNG